MQRFKLHRHANFVSKGRISKEKITPNLHDTPQQNNDTIIKCNMLGLSDNSLLKIWKEAVRLSQQETDSHPKGPGDLRQSTLSRLQTEYRMNGTKSEAMPDMLMLVALLFYLTYASEKKKNQTGQLTFRERDCMPTTSEMPTGTAVVQGCKTT
jgi:hypothetical protein